MIDSLTHQYAGRPIGQRAVSDVGVASDPANVCRAPVDIIKVVVKDILEGESSIEHVASHSVQHPLEEKQKTAYAFHICVCNSFVHLQLIF